MTRARALLAGALVAAACATTSCALLSQASGTTPTPAPPQSVDPATISPTPSSTPSPSEPSNSPTVSASPKDHVTEAVYKYYRVLDELSQKPPRDPYKKLFTITRDEEFDMWQDVMIQQSFDGDHQVGATKVMFARHGNITKKSGQQRVVVEACIDVSGVDMVNKKGKSVVAKNRPDRAAEKLWMIAEDGSWYVSKSRDGSWKC